DNFDAKGELFRQSNTGPRAGRQLFKLETGMTHETLWLRALLAAFAIIPAAAHAQGLTLSTGIEYSSGKYGETEKTEMYNLPVTAKYETGLWTFRLSLPIVRVTGPANVVVVGDDVVTIPGASTAR